MSASAASRLDPVSALFAIGIVMLGFAAVKAGVARWLAPALTGAALVQTVGFAAASRPLVVVGFAGMAGVLALVIRGLQVSRASRPVAQPALAA